VEKCGKFGRQIVAVDAWAQSSTQCRQTNDGAGSAALHACSACAGDYEDPERTGWPTDEEANDPREDAEGANVDEFPAEQK
jgi:hypothetical protein